MLSVINLIQRSFYAGAGHTRSNEHMAGECFEHRATGKEWCLMRFYHEPSNTREFACTLEPAQEAAGRQLWIDSDPDRPNKLSFDPNHPALKGSNLEGNNLYLVVLSNALMRNPTIKAAVESKEPFHFSFMLEESPDGLDKP